MRFYPDSYGTDLREFNKCHHPGGRPEGGQFCSEPGAGEGAPSLGDYRGKPVLSKPATGLTGQAAKPEQIRQRILKIGAAREAEEEKWRARVAEAAKASDAAYTRFNQAKRAWFKALEGKGLTGAAASPYVPISPNVEVLSGVWQEANKDPAVLALYDDMLATRPLYGEAKNAFYEMDQARGRALAAIREGSQAALHDVLALPEDQRSTWTVIDERDSTDPQRQRIAEGRAFVERMVAKTAVTTPDPISVQWLAPGRRAHAAPAEVTAMAALGPNPPVGKIAVSPSNGVSTVVHELTHHLEYRNVDALLEAVVFRDARLGGTARTQSLSHLYPGYHYTRDERTLSGSKDRFRDGYIGKVYDLLLGGPMEVGILGRGYKVVKDSRGTGHRATEILTMGVQYLYEDAYAFARTDPEHFNFTVGLIQYGPAVARKQYTKRRQRA